MTLVRVARYLLYHDPRDILRRMVGKNSGSALNWSGDPCLHSHVSSNLDIMVSTDRDRTTDLSPYPVFVSTMLSTSYFPSSVLTVRKSACISMLKSLLTCFNDNLFVFAGLLLLAHGVHDDVTLSMAFFHFVGHHTCFCKELLELVPVTVCKSMELLCQIYFRSLLNIRHKRVYTRGLVRCYI